MTDAATTTQIVDALYPLPAEGASSSKSTTTDAKLAAEVDRAAAEDAKLLVTRRADATALLGGIRCKLLVSTQQQAEAEVSRAAAPR